MKVTFIVVVLIILMLASKFKEAESKRKKRKNKKTSDATQDPDEVTELEYSSQSDLKAKMDELTKRQQAISADIDEEKSAAEMRKLKDEELELKKNVYRAELNHGEFSAERAAALHKLGRNIYHQARFLDVENIATEIVKIHEKMDGPESLVTAHALGNVGSVSYRLGHLKQCEIAMERALYIYIKEYGFKSKEVLLHRGKMLTFQIKNGEHSEGLSFEDFEDEYKDGLVEEL